MAVVRKSLAVRMAPTPSPTDGELMVVNGFHFPAYDRVAHHYVFRQLKNFEASLALCQARRVAVQAGGNVGIWPKWLAARFEQVYTFEPDPMNFRCLELNCPEANLVRLNAAVGAAAGGVKTMLGGWKNKLNCGGNYVLPGGSTPVIRIDDLELDCVDLIELDVEGYEYFAVQGAIETITRCRPIVQIEDKGHGRRYGLERRAARSLLEELGMVEKGRAGADYVFAWQ